MTDGENLSWRQADTDMRFAVDYKLALGSAEDGTQFVSLSLGLLPEGTEYRDALDRQDDPAMEGQTFLLTLERARQLCSALSEALR